MFWEGGPRALSPKLREYVYRMLDVLLDDSMHKGVFVCFVCDLFSVQS